ncbi:hypothetical protein E2C01_045825 [Portunus trituberculatus]|uniref:Uncharacterized protein n=1 Tax=Portunus trituberculatus TaxID=210409 RepID=A0A5B7G323_PORTR|nr:hypothetical protein [Portunus trituberculatus]
MSLAMPSRPRLARTMARTRRGGTGRYKRKPNTRLAYGENSGIWHARRPSSRINIQASVHDGCPFLPSPRDTCMAFPGSS